MSLCFITQTLYSVLGTQWWTRRPAVSAALQVLISLWAWVKFVCPCLPLGLSLALSLCPCPVLPAPCPVSPSQCPHLPVSCLCPCAVFPALCPVYSRLPVPCLCPCPVLLAPCPVSLCSRHPVACLCPCPGLLAPCPMSLSLASISLFCFVLLCVSIYARGHPVTLWGLGVAFSVASVSLGISVPRPLGGGGLIHLFGLSLSVSGLSLGRFPPGCDCGHPCPLPLRLPL